MTIEPVGMPRSKREQEWRQRILPLTGAGLRRNLRVLVSRSRDVWSGPMGAAVQAEDGQDASRVRSEGEDFHVSGIVVTRQGGNGR